MDDYPDISTKEKILAVSIDLFAQKGFKEVSVREIAKEVGIKASSLYKHYANKEDILSSIFDLFREKMVQTDFPKEGLAQYVSAVSPETYLNESFCLFRNVMWSPLTLKIARIITLEQRRNRSVRKFFMQELIEKPTRALQYVFDLMIQNGTIDAVDTQVLAEEYSSYIICLFFQQNFLQDGPSLEAIERKMARHNAFYANHILKRKGGTK